MTVKVMKRISETEQEIVRTFARFDDARSFIRHLEFMSLPTNERDTFISHTRDASCYYLQEV